MNVTNCIFLSTVCLFSSSALSQVIQPATIECMKSTTYKLPLDRDGAVSQVNIPKPEHPFLTLKLSLQSVGMNGNMDFSFYDLVVNSKPITHRKLLTFSDGEWMTFETETASPETDLGALIFNTISKKMFLSTPVNVVKGTAYLNNWIFDCSVTQLRK